MNRQVIRHDDGESREGLEVDDVLAGREGSQEEPDPIGDRLARDGLREEQVVSGRREIEEGRLDSVLVQVQHLTPVDGGAHAGGRVQESLRAGQELLLVAPEEADFDKDKISHIFIGEEIGLMLAAQ